MTISADLLPAFLIDPALTAAGAAALADPLRLATYSAARDDWHPETLRHLLVNVAACPLSPEALSATAAATARLAALLEAVRAMDAAALVLSRHLAAMGAATDLQPRYPDNEDAGA